MFDELRSDQMRSDQLRSDQLRSGQLRSDQMIVALPDEDELEGFGSIDMDVVLSLHDEPDDLSVWGALPPSMMTAALVEQYDSGRVMGASKVAMLRAQARLVARYQAAMLDTMMAIVDEYQSMDGGGDPAVVMESAVAEVRAALTLTRRAAESRLALACDVRDRLPAVMSALRQGEIDLAMAWVFSDGTVHLPDDLARAVVDEALRDAERLTTGQLRALVRRLCIDVHPDEAADRYRQATEERSVTTWMDEAGTGTIVASGLAPDRVAAAMDRVSGIARGLATAGETRTLDQLRADVFLDILEGTEHHSGRRGTVDVRVELTTLMGLDERSVEISGFGPVIAEIGRRLGRRGSEWRLNVMDRGHLVHSGVLRRRPTATQRRAVESRDVTCVFPGCRMPAAACDLDHRVPFSEGGTTHEDQLVALCRHDHVIRHRAGWSHRAGADGSHIWTSPLGVTYSRPPPR
jgi:hypothetical protein